MKKRNFIMTEMENARNKDEEAAAVSAVYGRIEKAGIWILYGEVSRHWISSMSVKVAGFMNMPRLNGCKLP